MSDAKSTQRPTHIDIDKLGQKLCTWGQWGSDDQRGTVNYITDAKVAAAAKLVQTGEIISLGVPMDSDGPQSGGGARPSPLHVMLSVPSDFILEGEIGIADDLIVLPLQASTQWDALAHISHRGTQYGGRDSGLTTTRGARVNGIEAVAGRIATRGVLCDLPRHLGVACLEPGYAITAEELVSALAATGVAVGEGDILLVRTGHMARCRPNHWRGYANSDTPGLGIDTLEWIHECRLAGVCTDTSAVEVRPSQIEGIPLPFHVVALVYMGLLLGEIFDLEELAVRCAADGRYDFFVVAPPLLVSGAVGAPINPYAIK